MTSLSRNVSPRLDVQTLGSFIFTLTLCTFTFRDAHGKKTRVQNDRQIMFSFHLNTDTLDEERRAKAGITEKERSRRQTPSGDRDLQPAGRAVFAEERQQREYGTVCRELHVCEWILKQAREAPGEACAGPPGPAAALNKYCAERTCRQLRPDMAAAVCVVALAKVQRRKQRDYGEFPGREEAAQDDVLASKREVTVVVANYHANSDSSIKM
ncbi:uncharacterized protein V6R79_023994 [Siganus canaliculatus]